MSVAPSTTDLPSPARGRLGLGLLAALALSEVPLAFLHGSYLPRSWLPSALVLAAFVLVIVSLGPRIRCERSQVALLGALALQAVWTCASLVWADSRANAWEEADRTLLYFLGAGLAFWALRLSGSRGLRVLVWGLLGAIAAVAGVVLLRLGTDSQPLALFSGTRLQYPITYHNGLGSLLMIGFWLALGSSTDRRRAWWLQAAIMAVAVSLAEMAILPQSRGTLWTFVLVVPWFFIVSPNRFRAAANLVVVGALAALAWPALTAVYSAGDVGGVLAAGATGGADAFPDATRTAARAILLTACAAAVYGAVSALIERRFAPLNRKVVRIVGALLVAAALIGAGVGVAALARDHDGVGGLVRDSWDEIVSDQGPSGQATTRFTEVGLSGRLSQWRLAWNAFREHPILGLGAQNYEFYHFQHRTTELTVRQPHSQPMQLLSELGAPGLALWIVFVAGVLGRGVLTRLRTARSKDQAATAAALLAAGSWTVHSSADWLWQLGGVTWPAVLLFGGLLGVSLTSAGGDDPPPRDGRAVWGGALVRWLLVGVAALLLVSGGAAYLSLRYLDVAARNVGSPSAALRAAHTAGLLNPFSPLPAQSAADTYRTTANLAAAGGGLGVTRASLDVLALAAAAWEEAVAREPRAWVLHYQSAVAIRELRDAGASPGLPSPPGDAPGSLALTQEETTKVESWRALSYQALTERARAHLTESARLNPLEPIVRQTLKDL